MIKKNAMLYYSADNYMTAKAIHGVNYFLHTFHSTVNDYKMEYNAKILEESYQNAEKKLKEEKGLEILDGFAVLLDKTILEPFSPNNEPSENEYEGRLFTYNKFFIFNNGVLGGKCA